MVILGPERQLGTHLAAAAAASMLVAVRARLALAVVPSRSVRFVSCVSLKRISSTYFSHSSELGSIATSAEESSQTKIE